MFEPGWDYQSLSVRQLLVVEPRRPIPRTGRWVVVDTGAVFADRAAFAAAYGRAGWEIWSEVVVSARYHTHGIILRRRWGWQDDHEQPVEES